MDVLRGFSVFLRPTAGRGVELRSTVEPVTAAHPATQALREAGHLTSC